MQDNKGLNYLFAVHLKKHIVSNMSKLKNLLLSDIVIVFSCFCFFAFSVVPLFKTSS